MIKKWLDRLQLSEWADKKVLTLSKGMSQKVQFISTIVAEPKLLILDEPFSGLDPVNADALRDAVLDLRRQGVTVVFSTHDMPAAERLCDRIFMIFKGNKVLDGTLDDIQSRYGQDTVRVRTERGAAALAGLAEVETFLDVGNYQDVKLKGNAQAFLHALSDKTAVYHFELKTPSLHDIFVRIAKPTAEDMRATPGGR
jgi:ABC-2 type transport system ATP-binding protein